MPLDAFAAIDKLGTNRTLAAICTDDRNADLQAKQKSSPVQSDWVLPNFMMLT
jgi:hypothetical protein